MIEEGREILRLTLPRREIKQPKEKTRELQLKYFDALLNLTFYYQKRRLKSIQEILEKLDKLTNKVDRLEKRLNEIDEKLIERIVFVKEIPVDEAKKLALDYIKSKEGDYIEPLELAEVLRIPYEQAHEIFIQLVKEGYLKVEEEKLGKRDL